MKYHTIICIALLVLAQFATGQECVDWATSLHLPIHFPDINGSAFTIIEDYLVVMDQPTLSVYSLGEDGRPSLVGDVVADVEVRRMRVIDDRVYVAAGLDGLLRVDLTNPDMPVVETVFSPGTFVTDVAAFDQGFVVVARDNESGWGDERIFVVDGFDDASTTVLSETVLGNDAEHVVTMGSYAYVAGDYLRQVDLSDPTQPILGVDVFHHPFQPHCSYRDRIVDVLFHDGSLYVVTDHVWSLCGLGYYIHFSRIDLSDPMELSASVWRDLLAPGHLATHDGTVSVAGAGHTEVFALGDLDPVFKTGHGPSRFEPSVSRGDALYFLDEDLGLALLDFSSHSVVEPIEFLPSTYDPGSCGRYGMSVEYNYGCDLDALYLSSIDWAIYEQTNPASPALLLEDHLVLYFEHNMAYEDATVEIAAQSDDWVIVGIEHHVWASGTWFYDRVYGTTNTVEQELSRSTRLPVCEIAGGTLWRLTWNSYSDFRLSTYRLSGSGVDCLGEASIDASPTNMCLDDRVYVIGAHEISIFDLDRPANLEPVEVLVIDDEVELKSPSYVEDGLLYSATPSGLAVVDIASGADPAILSLVDLGLTGSLSGFERSGDRTVFYGAGGWFAVDFTEPQSPVVLGSMAINAADGVVLVGDYVYHSADRSIDIYYVGDLAVPLWVGQTTTYRSTAKGMYPPCIKSGYLMAANMVLPQDCYSVLATDGDADWDQPGGGEPDDSPPSWSVDAWINPVTPNPFNPVATVSFNLRTPVHATVEVYDLKGQLVQRLFDGECPAGKIEVRWDGQDDRGRSVPSGSYLFRLRTPHRVDSTKATLVR